MSVSVSRLAVAVGCSAAVVLAGGVAAFAATAPTPVVMTDDEASSTPTPSTLPSEDGDDQGEDADEQGQDGSTRTGDDQGQDDGTEAGDDGADAGGTGDDGNGTDAGGTGPDAAGPAHHGLCTAWAHVQHSPGRAADSTAFRNLQAVGCDDVVVTDDPGDESGETAPDTDPPSTHAKAPKTPKAPKAPHSGTHTSTSRGTATPGSSSGSSRTSGRGSHRGGTHGGSGAHGRH